MVIVIDDAGILFLKYLLETALDLVTFLVVAAVVAHLVDKEQREAFDPALEQLTFFLEVGLDGFADLNPLHGLLVAVTDDLSAVNDGAVKEHDIAAR